MARQYGDVYSLKIINSTVVVLSSTTAIRDIMDKNSAIVSDRPASHFAQEVTGGNHMGASRYSKSLPIFGKDEVLLSAFRRQVAPSQTVCTRSTNAIRVQKSYKYTACGGNAADV